MSNIGINSNAESNFSLNPSDSSRKINAEVLTAALNEVNANKTSTASKHSHTPYSPGRCRICLEPDIDESNKCISPCVCRGTIAKVHKPCLEKWLAEVRSCRCEICGFKFKIKMISKYTIFGSVKAWFYGAENQEEVNEMIHDALILMVLIPIYFVMPLTIPYVNNQLLCDSLTNTVYHSPLRQLVLFGSISSALYMNFWFSYWVTYRTANHFTNWLNFYRRNQKVKLIDSEFTEISSNADEQ